MNMRNITKKDLQKRLIDIDNEKLSTLGRLAANVIHDLKNPITVIAGFAERLKRSIPPETKEMEYLDLICLEAKRLDEILTDILVFSNEPSYLIEKMDIHNIIDESLDTYENILKVRSISINKLFHDVTQIFIDKRQVKYAIKNLISNAVDAMPDEGTLTITTFENYLNKKNYVTVEITDTGVGISEENLLLIFEPFFTTKITTKGTGLGLPITKKIVEGHGGFVKVESSIGKGSTFSLYFPYRAK
jgi:signal transduction histidine kinase